MMRAAIPWLTVLCTALAACGDGNSADIQYSSNDKPIGTWPVQMQPSKNSRAVQDDDPSDSAVMEPSKLPTGMDRDMDMENAAPADPDSGVDDSEDTRGSSKPDARGIKDAGGAAPRLRFSVLTQVQHMRLSKTDPAFDDDARGPKNMGAIWISKRDGTFVRSLEVWRLHKERARHLVAYNKACDCPKPDVTATATLNKHKQHTTSWDMSDRDGAQAPEGAYTLHIEVADYDVDKPDKLDTMATNAQWSMDFDTHDAPKMLMPEAAQYYTNIELELLGP